MPNRICELIGADFPLLAFSHCRDVVAAVSRAGGFGVLGGSGFTPDSLAVELDWIDKNVDGKPYGVDIVFPEHQAVEGRVSSEALAAMVPDAHWEFVATLLESYGIPFDPEAAQSRPPTDMAVEAGQALLEEAFRHPIRLVANALGIAPPWVIEHAKDRGVPVAALVGAREHAVRQVRAGVDIVIAQGTEAGGHCGEVSTLVLVPEVIRAVREVRDVPVLAAGGIVNGRQMAGCMAMGAEGVWTGSVWLATPEAETSEIFRDKMIAASSRDTVRSAARTGKPSRQLRSPWHDAWHGADSPGALPLPLMAVVSKPAFEQIEKAAAAGNAKARELVSYFVGQGVGLIDTIRPAADVVRRFMEEYAEAVEDLASQLD